MNTQNGILSLFDSRDERYRSPFGAQPAGQPVFFRICLPRSLRCRGTRFCVNIGAPGEANPNEFYAMFWAGMEGTEKEWWDCHYTPEKPAVYRYWFELDTADGLRVLARQADGTAAPVPYKNAPRWQLTCYDPAFITPGWLAGGVMYQIFPDRFAKSKTEKKGVPSDRDLRDDWGGQPEWRPDEKGEIRNNDYFGGDLRGIEQRLDRLKKLGVNCLYLNPIFEAHSNHRYNTADYTRIDPLLGSEEDFLSLVKSARQVGIRILLDGVFSHTGSDSVYFNREGRYSESGAVQSKQSPYYPWYRFSRWPDVYAAWWGFKTLPEVDERNPGFNEYINGKEGVVRSRIRQGTGGWRLDVADELPDEFLNELRKAAKAENSETIVLGEVWEDASNKESYGSLRRYLLGGQLDSVMNYPFRTAVLSFLRGGKPADFFNIILDIVENYPPQVTRLLMNPIGTHDTERALTVLAGEPAGKQGREWQAAQMLTPEARERGMRLMRLASALQYTLPGVPCIYYGDEAGMEGYRDPFNRRCYPWGQEDEDLLHWYHRLGQLRHACAALREGRFFPLAAEEGLVCYERQGGGERLLCSVNVSDFPKQVVLPEDWKGCTVSLGGGSIEGKTLTLPPLDCALAVNTL